MKSLLVKIFIAVCAFLALNLTLFGCGGNNSPADSGDDKRIEETENDSDTNEDRKDDDKGENKDDDNDGQGEKSPVEDGDFELPVIKN